MGTIDNMASALGHFYVQGTRDFAGQLPFVLGCASRAQAYHIIPTAVRVAREIAAGKTHTGNPLLDSTLAKWLLGAAKQATRLGKCAAQTPPVTSENMLAACDAATSFLDNADVDHVDLTVQQVERLTLFTVMVFSWCTMLRPDNLLGLAVRDVVFAPLHGANLAFFQEHGRPRWVKVSYTRLKTNVVGTAPVPAYYFWSSMASTEEMHASPQLKDSSLCVRCPWLWCDMPFWAWTYTRLRVEDPAFDMGSRLPFFTTPVVGGAGDAGATGTLPISQAWWQQRLDIFAIHVDPSLSTRGVGGLYGFRRGATQFW
ncbi:hypothetical protein I4F81_008541 [Pyropia yezoensis]|uniref:Uncharacterized protein n=1 Tax=Pyropia yezoensis TaxID=2788 RepID=A0ACC3C7T0_PYRYE|nr:hypothetical protein I4F81_008541 [Neopyropia yezoensis]